MEHSRSEHSKKLPSTTAIETWRMEVIQGRVGQDVTALIFDAAMQAMRKDVLTAYETICSLVEEIIEKYSELVRNEADRATVSEEPETESQRMITLAINTQRLATIVDRLDVELRGSVMSAREDAHQIYLHFSEEIALQHTGSLADLSLSEMNEILEEIAPRYSGVMREIRALTNELMEGYERVAAIVARDLESGWTYGPFFPQDDQPDCEIT